MKLARQRPPSFFWQGVLIVLPVVILAGAAIVSLRQDRILARHEAVERAEVIAQDMADGVWYRLTSREVFDAFKDHTFRVDASGRLVFPPPAPALPVPQVLDAAVLDPTQQKRWAELRRAETGGIPDDDAIAAVREFLASNPPVPFAAIARFQLGQRLAARGQPADAAAAFASVREEYPGALSEGGLPLAQLAELKQLELASRTAASNAVAIVALNAFCSNVVSQPGFLSQHLLDRAASLESTLGVDGVVGPWRREWARQEPLRVLAQAAFKEWANATARDDDAISGSKPMWQVPALSWFEAPDLGVSPQRVVDEPRSLVANGDGAKVRSRNAVAAFSASGQFLSNGIIPTQSQSARDQVRFHSSLDRKWLATRIDDGRGGFAIVCRAMGFSAAGGKFTLGSPAWLELRESLPALPPWLGVTIELAGVPLLSTNDLQNLVYRTGGGKGSGQSWTRISPGSSQEVLATVRRLENGIERLRVTVHLVSRDMLFSRQRTRTYLFGLLVATSAAAALIGFVSARRAFAREHQLSAMKSNFVSSVSHELRAPIASVRLLAESLERGRIAEPAKQHEYFRFIVQECRRLSSLIENVLDFARIEQGRKQYEFEPTDVAALVTKTVKLIEPVAAEKQVALRLQLSESTTDAAPRSEPILDAAAIQQALVNLIDNAVKHAPVGSEVTVGLDFTSAGPVAPDSLPPAASGGEEASSQQPNTPLPPAHFRLWVQDHGRGIPPAERERIFERFYRPGSEMRRETHGVGIGLSIVKHIIEAHRGSVWVESELGRGSRFIVELPVNGVLQPSPK